MTTIKEVSAITGLSAYAIRFYERKGLVQVPRNANGIRDFDQASITKIQAIAHYRNVGMSLEDIKVVFDNYENHELSVRLLKETKTKLDQEIASLENTRAYLINKIALHQRIANQERKNHHDQK